MVIIKKDKRFHRVRSVFKVSKGFVVDTLAETEDWKEFFRKGDTLDALFNEGQYLYLLLDKGQVVSADQLQ